MLTCQQLTELVTDFAEGRLPLADRLSFALHLGLCRDCRDYVRQLRTAARALEGLPAPEMPDGLEDEILRRFRSWKVREQP